MHQYTEANSQTATPSEATPFSYWSIKPWFLTEGKLATVLIIPSSWGSQRIAITRASVLQADIAEMKNSSAVVAAAMKTMSETLSSMGLWIPRVDTSMDAIRASIEAMAARVTILEAEQAPERDAPPEDADAHEPRPKGRGAEIGRAHV